MKRDKHKILLIEPPFYRLFKDTYSLTRFPLSLAYLAGAIKNETRWSVMVYNADFHSKDESIKVKHLTGKGFESYLFHLKDLSRRIWRDVKLTIQEYEPDVIGISAKSQNFASACIVAKLAKEVNKQIIIIAGGPHPSLVGSDTLSCPDIDIAVRGEGEETLVELLDAIETQKTFDTIKGTIYRKNGRIVENEPRKFIKDLDSLCFPHESAPEVLKDYSQYPLEAFKYIFASRGCPYNCAFCGSPRIWSRKVRFRSVDNIIREIKLLQKQGLRFVHFDDDIFGVTKKNINDFCQALIKHCPGLKWSCELHVKLVDEQIISLMKAAGCFSIQLGIESGNNGLLNDIGKNITIEEGISSCKIIKKHGLLLYAFFMVGFPQETIDTLNDTFTAIKKVKCDSVIYSIFTPYPGTRAFEYCKKKGLIRDNFDISLYNHKSPANCFCMNIRPARFRLLVSQIEKMIDRKNWLNRMKQIFSLNSFRRIQELGVAKSFHKGVRILTRK